MYGASWWTFCPSGRYQCRGHGLVQQRFTAVIHSSGVDANGCLAGAAATGGRPFSHTCKWKTHTICIGARKRHRFSVLKLVSSFHIGTTTLTLIKTPHIVTTVRLHELLIGISVALTPQKQVSTLCAPERRNVLCCRWDRISPTTHLYSWHFSSLQAFWRTGPQTTETDSVIIWTSRFCEKLVTSKTTLTNL